MNAVTGRLVPMGMWHLRLDSSVHLATEEFPKQQLKHIQAWNSRIGRWLVRVSLLSQFSFEWNDKTRGFDHEEKALDPTITHAGN